MKKPQSEAQRIARKMNFLIGRLHGLERMCRIEADNVDVEKAFIYPQAAINLMWAAEYIADARKTVDQDTKAELAAHKLIAAHKNTA